MIAVYKRELRSYLTSMIGYLFIFFILLLTGIYIECTDIRIPDQCTDPYHESSCRRT